MDRRGERTIVDAPRSLFASPELIAKPKQNRARVIGFERERESALNQFNVVVLVSFEKGKIDSVFIPIAKWPCVENFNKWNEIQQYFHNCIFYYLNYSFWKVCYVKDWIG